MAESLRGGLSFTMSGFGYWSHDIGGFEMTATPDLYKRWMQFGLLSTHSRLHGSKSYRVPWLFDEEANDVCREFTRLKARMMPYIFQASVDANRTGVPVMRAMILEFESDPAVRYLDMQYMIGSQILAAPVFSADGRAEYYLPAGTWTHLLTGEVREGGRWFADQYDYFSLPLYVRENTLFVKGAIDNRTEYDYAADAQIQLYELKDGAEAFCEITDTSGNTTFAGSASRAGNCIVLHGSGRMTGMTWLLKNIPVIKSVTGAAAEQTDQGVMLIPEANEMTVQL